MTDVDDDWESESDKLRAHVEALESALRSALRDLAYQIVKNNRLVERLAKCETWSAEDEEYFRSGTRYPGQ